MMGTISSLLLLAAAAGDDAAMEAARLAAVVREASQPIFLSAEAICLTVAGVQPNHRTRPPGAEDDEEGALESAGEARRNDEPAELPPLTTLLLPRRVWEARV